RLHLDAPGGGGVEERLPAGPRTVAVPVDVVVVLVGAGEGLLGDELAVLDAPRQEGDVVKGPAAVVAAEGGVHLEGDGESLGAVQELGLDLQLEMVPVPTRAQEGDVTCDDDVAARPVAAFLRRVDDVVGADALPRGAVGARAPVPPLEGEVVPGIEPADGEVAGELGDARRVAAPPEVAVLGEDLAGL